MTVSKARITAAAACLRAGKLVVIPTETFYGLAADAFNRAAIARVFKAKGRKRRKPLLVLIGAAGDVDKLAARVSSAARLLMRAFWPRKASPRGGPGPLTIVFPAKRSLPSALTAGTGTVAVRLPSHPAAAALAKRFGPITGTSANISGKPAQRTVAGVMRQLQKNPDIALILDAGATRGGKPSTIIDATKSPPVILREGAVSRQAIEQVTAL